LGPIPWTRETWWVSCLKLSSKIKSNPPSGSVLWGLQCSHISQTSLICCGRLLEEKLWNPQHQFKRLLNACTRTWSMTCQTSNLRRLSRNSMKAKNHQTRSIILRDNRLRQSPILLDSQIVQRNLAVVPLTNSSLSSVKYSVLNHSLPHPMYTLRQCALSSQEISLEPQEPATMLVAHSRTQELLHGQQMCNWSWTMDLSMPLDLSDWIMSASTLTNSLVFLLMLNFRRVPVRRFLHSDLCTVTTTSNSVRKSLWPSRSMRRTTKLRVQTSTSSLKRLSSHWSKPMATLSMSMRIRERSTMRSTNLTCPSIRTKQSINLTCLLIRGVWSMRIKVMSLLLVHQPKRFSTKKSKMRRKRVLKIPFVRKLLDLGHKAPIVIPGWLGRKRITKVTFSINK